MDSGTVWFVKKILIAKAIHNHPHRGSSLLAIYIWIDNCRRELQKRSKKDGHTLAEPSSMDGIDRFPKYVCTLSPWDPQTGVRYKSVSQLSDTWNRASVVSFSTTQLYPSRIRPNVQVKGAPVSVGPLESLFFSLCKLRRRWIVVATRVKMTPRQERSTPESTPRRSRLAVGAEKSETRCWFDVLFPLLLVRYRYKSTSNRKTSLTIPSRYQWEIRRRLDKSGHKSYHIFPICKFKSFSSESWLAPWFR